MTLVERLQYIVSSPGGCHDIHRDCLNTITRLTTLDEGYKGQVEYGASEIARLEGERNRLTIELAQARKREQESIVAIVRQVCQTDKCGKPIEWERELCDEIVRRIDARSTVEVHALKAICGEE